MRAVLLMFDSLNRHFLSPYGATWTRTPNFQRLARRAVTFDRSYVCSMPCMPARRDLHTGRPGFLHRGWGPMEPYDQDVFQLLRTGDQSVYSHLATDHYHYFETGGANYHTAYDSWEFFRGQEGDPWIGQVADPVEPRHINGKNNRQDWVNRPHVRRDEDHYQTKTVRAGLDFLDRNAAEDDWLLQVELFDPHEPFFCDPQWKSLFPDPDSEADAPLLDWPGYGKDLYTREQVEQARRNYAALLAKCDASLGRVLDAFDRHDLWKDTMLVVGTDHGIQLGEHGWTMKNAPPMYEETSHTPLFMWDPRHNVAGERRGSLVQPMLDLPVTLLNYFGRDVPDTMLGHDLGPVVEGDAGGREAAIFGYFNQHVNLVTEQHAYYRGAANDTPSDSYTLAHWHMRNVAPLDPMRHMELAEPLPFSQGVPPLKVPGSPTREPFRSSLLFDLKADPAQERPLDDPQLEAQLAEQMTTLMKTCDAPAAQFERMGLSA